MSDPILNLNDPAQAQKFNEGFRTKHPGADWVKDKLKKALGWYSDLLDPVVNDVMDRIDKGTVKDQSALEDVIEGKVTEFRGRGPDAAGGSENPADNEPPDLGKAVPGGSAPVDLAGRGTKATPIPVSPLDQESPFLPEGEAGKNTGSREIDIQSLVLDQPLEWSEARDDRTTRMNGENIKQIQTGLNTLGGGVAVDGWFGPDTAEAVKEFQEKNGLDANGIFDEDSLRLMQKLLEE